MSGAYLEVQTLTWEKDTHGLFDYGAKSLKKSSFRLLGPSDIFRQNSDCYIPADNILEGSVPLVRIDYKSGDFSASLLSEDAGAKMWLVIRYFKPSYDLGFRLREGDWVKLGRVRLRVQKISAKAERHPQAQLPDMFFKGIDNERIDIKQEGDDNKENSPCRICLLETGTAVDPLICPCNCAGTMKYVHLNCLREWIKSKVSSRVTEKGMSVYIKDLSCELCSSQLPTFINYQGQQVSLVSLSFPTRSFVMLEEFKPDDSKRIGFHIVALDEGQFGTIGRGHDCDIKISDISVSRKHSRVKMTGGEFYLEDMKSKFGTLVKLNSQVALRSDVDFSVQVNRTVIQFSYKRPFSWKNLCCCVKKIRVENGNASYFTQPEHHVTNSDGLSHRGTMNPALRGAEEDGNED